MESIPSRLLKGIEILNNDGVIAIPTETVYGLAGNIYSESAILKIFELKQRPLFNPLIVHIHSLAELDRVAVDIPKVAILLAKKFWPGSLTLLLKKHSSVLSIITSGKDSVAVRIPNHPLTLKLLQLLPYPLAAPSANPFGCISPTTAAHVAAYFKEDLPYILDGGACEAGIESTIIGFENEQAVLYRYGSISVEEIELVCGKLKININKENAPDAPGMLSKHYAPNTKTFLTDDVDRLMGKFKGKKVGLLLFNQPKPELPAQHQEILSSTSDLKQAAANLYAAMHRLDSSKLDFIIAEKLPNKGLGKTINDRLERATK